MSWFQRAKNFLFPEEQGREAQSPKAPSDVKRQRGGDPPTGSSTQQPRPQQPRTQNIPPGARVVRQVIPPPEPVLLEAEALDKKKAGVQGLLWYARKQKQDAHGDVADDFLEEGSPPTLLTPQRQIKPAPALTVKRVEKGNVILARKVTKS